jgi:hypothetical protein
MGVAVLAYGLVAWVFFICDGGGGVACATPLNKRGR